MRPLALIAAFTCAACGGPTVDPHARTAPSADASAIPVLPPSASAPATASDGCDGGLGYGASCNGQGNALGVPGKDRDPSAPHIEVSVVGSAVGLPSELVARVVRQNVPLMHRCYRDAISDAGTPPQGRVRVTLAIDASGKATTLRDAGSSLAGDVRSCITRAIEGGAFPAPEGARAGATVEVRVTPP